jgi:phosphotransferase system enzyme I (PtsI)
MKNGTDLRISARSVSRGIAIGKVVCLYGSHRQFYRVEIDESVVDKEVRRFRAATRLAIKQIKNLHSLSAERLGESLAGIFDVQGLILDDESLRQKIENAIREQQVNAEWAVKVVTDSYIEKYKAIDDERLRERYIDLEDVRDRLLSALGGGRRRSLHLERNSVLVSSELSPSTLVELADSQPAGIITEHGGWTSHTFILARELNIPAVTGVRKLLRRVNTGDRVIIDGFRGEMILRPTDATTSTYVQDSIAPDFTKKALLAHGTTTKTLDAREIIIRANADIPGLYERACRDGARGIGLYRSEYLFNRFRGFPTEAEQVAAYRAIARSAGADGVRIRTFDLTVEDVTDNSFGRQKNPALGLRAIRLSLARENQFRSQLRALLQAATESKIDIILPMISDVTEVVRTKEIISDEKAKLDERGVEYGELGVGAMIEVPAAVVLIDEILEEVEHLSLGTNDLVQYLLAVDRDNEAVADSFRTLSPAVIRSISTVIDAARQATKPMIVCGEMAGSPFYVPLLIGLGAVELSMNPNSVRRVRHVISGIAYEEARELASKILAGRTAAHNEAMLRQWISTEWSHLFPTEVSPV